MVSSVIKCDKCGSSNIFYDHAQGKYRCLKCGFEWRLFQKPEERTMILEAIDFLAARYGISTEEVASRADEWLVKVCKLPPLKEWNITWIEPQDEGWFKGVAVHEMSEAINVHPHLRELSEKAEDLEEGTLDPQEWVKLTLRITSEIHAKAVRDEMDYYKKIGREDLIKARLRDLKEIHHPRAWKEMKEYFKKK